MILYVWIAKLQFFEFEFKVFRLTDIWQFFCFPWLKTKDLFTFINYMTWPFFNRPVWWFYFERHFSFKFWSAKAWMVQLYNSWFWISYWSFKRRTLWKKLKIGSSAAFYILNSRFCSRNILHNFSLSRSLLNYIKTLWVHSKITECLRGRGGELDKWLGLVLRNFWMLPSTGWNMIQCLSPNY